MLTALHDAEDALARFGAARGKASADVAAQLTQQQYDAGTTTMTDMLEMERQQLAAEQALTQAKTAADLAFRCG